MHAQLIAEKCEFRAYRGDEWKYVDCAQNELMVLIDGALWEMLLLISAAWIFGDDAKQWLIMNMSKKASLTKLSESSSTINLEACDSPWRWLAADFFFSDLGNESVDSHTYSAEIFHKS